MNLLTIPRVDQSRTAAVWNRKVVVPKSTITTNDAYKVPTAIINDIAFRWVTVGVNPVIEFTYDSFADIENDSAVWVAWNKSSAINKALTAMRFRNTSTLTDSLVVVTIRGELNE